VIGGAFQVIGRNIANVTVLGLVLSGVPIAIVSYFQFGMMRGALAGAQTGTFNFNPAMIGGAATGILVAVIFNAILQGALIYLTVQDLNGQKPSLGDCFATGLRNFLPLIGVSILFSLAVAVGFLLLIVPGIMILCAWCVAVPSLVADRTGVFGAFSRSAELTSGNRWPIFGLLVIIWVISLVIGLITNAVTGVGGFGAQGMAAIERLTSPLSMVMLLIRQTITAVIASTGVAVLYVELRKAREGLGPQWLAEVFR
jgi:hypothetical protein